MVWLSGIGFQLLAQMPHINTQIMAMFHRIQPPYLIQQLIEKEAVEIVSEVLKNA